MKIHKFIILTMVFFLYQSLLFADDLKIAVIDMQKVSEEYYKTKITIANINKQTEVFKSYAEKLNDSRLKLQEEFKSLRDASLNIALTNTERETKNQEAQKIYRQFQEKDIEMTQYYREKQTQIMEDYKKNKAQILNEIKKEIEKKSIVEGYTMVFNVSCNSPTDIPAVVYCNKKYDITDAILEELNRGHNSQSSDKTNKNENDSKTSKNKKK